MVEKVKKGRGRPRAPEDERRVGNLTIRIRADLKEALGHQAEKSGRSLSAEAEVWLGQALLSEGVLDQALDLAFGRQFAGLILLLGRCVRDTAMFGSFGDDSRAGPFNEPYLYDQMARATLRVFDILRPDGAIKEPKRMLNFLGSVIPDHFLAANAEVGVVFANIVLLACAGGVGQAWMGEWSSQIRERLGPELIQRIIKDSAIEAMLRAQPEASVG